MYLNPDPSWRRNRNSRGNLYSVSPDADTSNLVEGQAMLFGLQKRGEAMDINDINSEANTNPLANTPWRRGKRVEKNPENCYPKEGTISAQVS